MHIPVPWAIALAVAGATAVVVALGIATHRSAAAAPERVLAHLSHLLGGGLSGFTALAFPPAWPLVAAIGGMLTMRAVQAGRSADLGLLLAGFGAAWTLLLGSAILADLSDPAIHGPDQAGWLLFGSAVLVAGLVLLIADTLVGGGQPGS
ncbi:MAG: hypothetical protein ACRDHD_07955 [Candidatus Limnocylindria bacterium]